MNFEIIDKSDAPAQGPERRKRRNPAIEEMVTSLEPGKVARIQLDEDEKPRPLVEQIFKTGARQGKIVDVWEVGGLLFAEQVTDRD
ncbi:MAG: hypothetical protein ACR2J8_04680 [Thermomicrobiales bacterium]